MKAVEAAIGVLSKLTKTTVECHLPSTAGFDNIGTALGAFVSLHQPNVLA